MQGRLTPISAASNPRLPSIRKQASPNGPPLIRTTFAAHSPRLTPLSHSNKSFRTYPLNPTFSAHSAESHSPRAVSPKLTRNTTSDFHSSDGTASPTPKHATPHEPSGTTANLTKYLCTASSQTPRRTSSATTLTAAPSTIDSKTFATAPFSKITSTPKAIPTPPQNIKASFTTKQLKNGSLQ